MIETMHSEELRMAIVGKTGSGKSACGNTILGRKAFESCFSGSSITKTSRLEAVDLDEKYNGRRVKVVDTPGYGNTHLRKEEVYNETARCLTLSAPGPHAFLLVVALGRYTEIDDRAVDQLAQIFGEEAVSRHTLVLFTRGDDLEGTVEGFVKIAPPGLQALIRRCGGRYHVFNNKNANDSVQVKELIVKVEKMARQTATGFYDSGRSAAIKKEWGSLLGWQWQPGNHNPGGGRRRRQTQSERGSGGSCLQSCVNAALTAVATGAALGAVFRLVVPLAATAVGGFFDASLHFASSLLAGGAAGAVAGGSAVSASVVDATEADSTSEADLNTVVAGNGGLTI